MALERFLREQGRMDETVVNTALARVLSDHFNIYAVPETRHDLRPDVLMKVLGIPVVIEAVFKKKDARDEAKADLMKKLRQGFGELGVSLVYPKELSVPMPIPQLEKVLLSSRVEASIWSLRDNEGECVEDWRFCRLGELIYSMFQIGGKTIEMVDVEDLVRKLSKDIRSLGNLLRLYIGKGALTIAKDVSFALGLAEPENEKEAEDVLSIACLALFDAAVLYEALVSARLTGNLQSYDVQNCSEAFKNARSINYVPIYDVAIKVLDTLPHSPDINQFLVSLWGKSYEIATKRYYLKHDLTGHLYHLLLKRGLAKIFATFFTKPPIAEMLASIAIHQWDDKIVDPACGSGTLLVSSYRMKLDQALTLEEPMPLNDLHKTFVEEDIIGLDAMLFASHMTLTNLSLQMPEVPLSKSGICDALCRGELTGSLELLISDKVWSQAMITGDVASIAKVHAMKEGEPTQISIPKEAFDVVIMNPPFTQSARVPHNIGYEGSKRLSEALQRRSKEYKNLLQAGLAAPFFILASELARYKGRIALVLPIAPLVRTSWHPIREKLLSEFDIDHIILSWEKGSPSFSDGSVFREMLLVARKLEKKHNDLDKKHVIVIHLDRQPKTTFEGAELGRKIKEVSGWLRNAEPLTTYSLRIRGIPEPYGEAIVILQEWLGEHIENWYAFAAFRDIRLLKTFMSIVGMSYDPNLPSFPIRSLGELGEIKSVIDHTSGLNITESGSGYNAVWGSGAERVYMLEMEPTHVVRKVGKPKVDPEGKSGIFLIPRKLQIDTSAVFGVKSKEPVISNVWWPVNVSKDDAKLLSLWLNSTWGTLCLYAYRQETRGTYGEYKKEHWSTVPVLDITSLSEDIRKSLLNLYEEVKAAQLPRLSTQLDQCIKYLRGEINEEPIRVKIDSQLINTSTYKENEEDLRHLLLDLYSRFKEELEKLTSVMTRRKFL